MKGAKFNPNENDEIFYLMEIHWNIFWDIVEIQGYDKKVFCSNCNDLRKFNFKDHHMTLRCQKCGKTYSPTASTIFNNSKIYLPIWLKAIHIIKNVNQNITLSALSKHLECTNVTACNMRRKIRGIDENSIEYRLSQKYKEDIIADF